MTVRILVFAKAPVAGRAKTRLIPALGAAGSARLQAMLLEDALRRAHRAGPAALELWGTGDDPDGLLAAAARRHRAVLRWQCSGDLGERMHAALSEATADGTPALVLGTDAPGLTPDRIGEAMALLSCRDAVLAPAFDGGYVLLGLHRSPRGLFHGIEWGSEHVLEATRARLRDLHWDTAELPTQWDVDRPEDLARFSELGEPWIEWAVAGAGPD